MKSMPIWARTVKSPLTPWVPEPMILAISPSMAERVRAPNRMASSSVSPVVSSISLWVLMKVLSALKASTKLCSSALIAFKSCSISILMLVPTSAWNSDRVTPANRSVTELVSRSIISRALLILRSVNTLPPPVSVMVKASPVVWILRRTWAPSVTTEALIPMVVSVPSPLILSANPWMVSPVR